MSVKNNLIHRISRIFKLRFAILYPVGLWALVFGYATLDSIRLSLGVILLGMFVRSWANGYAVKLDKLTTCGPYGYLRHPLYFGTFFIVAGVLILLKMPWLGIAVILAIMSGVYFSTISKEESMLNAKFGEDYQDYRKSVPALIPSIFAYKKGEKWKWELSRYLRSQEYKVIIWVIILGVGMYLKGIWFVAKEPMRDKHMILVAIAIGLAVLDMIGEYFRKQSKKSAK